jgi:CRISPR-associated protein Csb1
MSAFASLVSAPRLLIEATLKPIQGNRFQPTGFADLGPARFTGPDGSEMLLVESSQSVANRLEGSVYDPATGDLMPELQGLPYVKVLGSDGQLLTSTLVEAHRLNSPYVLDASDDQVKKLLNEKLGNLDGGPVDFRKVAKVLFELDPNSLLHGCFLEKIDGRLRITRAVTGFIEATGVRPAESGGVKNDRVNQTGEASEGKGNVPYSRTEFTASNLSAYFNIDLALLRGYGLSEDAVELLIALAMLKIRKFLESGLRLRTACDLDTIHVKSTRPESFTFPEAAELLKLCKTLIGKCESSFAKPPVTVVTYAQEISKKKKEKSK